MHRVREADVMIVRGTGLVDLAIGVAGRDTASHAGLIGWAYGHCFVIQQTSCGQKRPLLADVVRRYPGRVDIYRFINAPCWQDKYRMLQMAMDLASEPYGWADILRIACYHLPVVRLALRLWNAAPDEESKAVRRKPLNCAGLVSAAARSIGIDLVPHLSDSRTEPADLVRSALLRYHCTLE